MADTASAASSLGGAEHGKSPVKRLSFMMFLQYAVWGVWLPYIATYLEGDPILNDAGARIGGGLGFTSAQVGWILGLAGSIGALTAPFLAGQIADRFLNAEKYLGLLLILGGLVKYATYYAETFNSFLLLSILYSITYMPTLALTNSIAFANLRNIDREFGPVRTLGTIGWIVASNLFPILFLLTNVRFGWFPDNASDLVWVPPMLVGEQRPDQAGLIADALRVSGVLAVCYGLWAMVMLPKTPPTRRTEHPLAFLNAFKLMKHPGVAVVTLAALFISMIHQVYFIRTPVFLEALEFKTSQIGAIMSVGQVSEIAFLAMLGLFLKRLGIKWILALGCVAYFARFGLFALAEPSTNWMVIAANTLHGLCYGFFFAGSYMYIERVAPSHIRHSAQTVFGMVILGLGPVLAGFYNEWLSTLGAGATGEMGRWPSIWLAQAGIGAACAALIAVGFRPGLPEANKAA
jgi:nucleoside transporter